MAMQRAGHLASQTPQAMQRSRSKRGFGQALLGMRCATAPAAVSTAPEGQTRPQAPHSMQREGSILCWIFLSPAMAETGQAFVQAVQPMQAVVTLKDIFSSARELSQTA